MTKLKWCNLSGKITEEMLSCWGEIPRRAGMYNWTFMFGGEFQQWDNPNLDLEKYDVVQINMSGVDQAIVPYIRDRIPRGSSTKLILNNDYVAEAWGGMGQSAGQYHKLQGMGDMVFGTEPHQVSHMIDTAYVIPHPHYRRGLRRFKSLYKHEGHTIGAMYHYWEGQTYTTALLRHKLKLEYDNKVRMWLYGYRPTKDMKHNKWHKFDFDSLIRGMLYPDFIEELLRCEAVYEPCWYHTYGRTTADTAIIGAPTFGTDRVFSMKVCWPETSCDPLDLKKLQGFYRKIRKGGTWLQEQLDFAFERSEVFGYKASKERLLAALEQTDEGRFNQKEVFDWEALL